MTRFPTDVSRLVILLLAALLSAQGWAVSAPAAPSALQAAVAASLQSVSQRPDEVTLTVTFPALRWEPRDGRVAPRIDGCGPGGEAGSPQVLIRHERIALPAGGELQILGVDAQWISGTIPGELAPFPVGDGSNSALDPTFSERSAWFPADLVRVVEPNGAFRDLRFATLEIAPVQVDAATGTYRFAQRVDVHVSRGLMQRGAALGATGGRAPQILDELALSVAHGAADVGRTPLGSTGGAPAATTATAAAPTYPAWQFEVDADGLYKITYEWAQANQPGLFSFLTANSPARYRLTVQGVEVPLLVRDAGTVGTFGPGDFFEFYGQSVGAVDLFAPSGYQKGDYTDTNVYRLDVATPPARIADQTGTRSPISGYAVPASFRTTVHYEPDTKHQGFVPADGVDHWYVDPTLDAQGTPFSLDQSVPTPSCAAGASVALRSRLLGYSYPNNYHRTELRTDGILRNSADWDGFTEFTQGVTNGAITFTATLGPTTVVNIKLPLGRTVNSTSITRDTVGLNWYELDYDRLYQAASDALVFTVPNAKREVRLDGFSAAGDVWEISDAPVSPAGMSIAIPKRVVGATFTAGQVRFEMDDVAAAPATRRFIAAGNNGYLTPRGTREDKPPSALDAGLGSSLKAPGLGADWVVIGHRSLLDMTPGSRLRQLVSQRQARGLSTAVIDVTDVYDEFTSGISDPQAIRDFMSYALANWSPAPTYLLLVGDATRDYKNLYGWQPARNLVPTAMWDVSVNTQFGYYLSDTWFAAVVGNDDVPDVLVGRIPAHTLAEAEEVFRKTVAYETGPQPVSWAGRALLVSTGDDAGSDFKTPHDNVYANWFAAGPQTATKIYEADCTDCTVPAQTTNSQIDANVNTGGAAILSYAGHGSYKAWGRASTVFMTDGVDPTTGLPKPDDLADFNLGTPLSFDIHAACITGHFAQDNSKTSSNDTWYTFLEDWLLTANKGAIGGIAPSHLEAIDQIYEVLNPVYLELFGKHKERLAGRIDLALRLSFDGLGDVVAERSFVLEGDPALRLAVPAPAAPTLVSIAQAGSGALTLTWTSVPGAAKYRVYRTTNIYGSYTKVAETTALTATDTGLSNCQEYFYYVVAVDANNFESRWSNYNETCYGTRDPAECKAGTPTNPVPPHAPTLQSVTDTQEGGHLRVQWNNADRETDLLHYRVRWGTTAGGPYVNEAVVDAVQNSYLMVGLQNKTRYYVVVRGENCDHVGANSNELSGVPHLVEGINPPRSVRDLRVQKSGANDLRLTWTVPTDTVWGVVTNISAIQVHASQTGPVFPIDATTLKATLGATATSWTHVGQQPAAAGGWYYSVVAKDTDGYLSAGGDELPNGIGDLKLKKLSPTQIQLTWSKITRAVDPASNPTIYVQVNAYNVYGQSGVLKRKDCGPTNRLAADVPALSTTVSMPAPTFFTYQVLAKDVHGGESVW